MWRVGLQYNSVYMHYFIFVTKISAQSVFLDA